MEKNNNGKMVAIVALVVAVVALSVGFAAFADDLTIDGTATVESKNEFDDDTATNGLHYQANSNKCYLTSDSTAKTAIVGADVGTLSTDAWSGISMPLGDSANSITCEAVVENLTSYKAYLTSLAANGGLTCTSSGANKTSNETNVCGATTLTVKVGDVAGDTITVTNAAVTNSSTQGEIAATSGTALVTVTVAYTGAQTDENVTITLPTITHHYSSAR